MSQKFKIGDKITRHPDFILESGFDIFCRHNHLSRTTVFTVVQKSGFMPHRAMLEAQDRKFPIENFNTDKFVLVIDPNQSVGDYA